MNISRLALVTALGLGLSSMGCLGNTDTLVQDIEPPRFETLEDPGGGIHPNGLPPSYFHAHRARLVDAMAMPLTSDGIHISEDVLGTGILKSDEGALLFRYAMQCALPVDTYVFRDDGDTDSSNDVQYPGAGLLTTTGGWITSSLSTGARQDLLACLLAHLNPYPEHVPILVSGANVTNKSASEPTQPDFSFEEAVWIARFTSSNVPELYVWPLEDLEMKCEHKLFTSLQTRVCGEGIEGCGVEIREDTAMACTVSTLGYYTCFGVPAIRTRLEPGSVSVLHGGCGPVGP